MSIANPASFIENGPQRFLIFDAPNDANLPSYLVEFKKHNVKVIVRVCDPTYHPGPLEAEGIRVLDWPFSDGSAPPSSVIDHWRGLVRDTFGGGNPDKVTVGVHCVAGLGRAPVLVVIGLIESGVDNLKAIEMVRSKRRGSINSTQLKWLSEYHPESKCAVM